MRGRLARPAWVGAAEALAILTLMAYVDHAGMLSFRLVDLQPHPYWVPVLIAAASHGRPVGYFAACAAAVFDTVLGSSALAQYFDFYDFLLANSRDPMLWLAAAAVLGRFQERQAQRRRDAEVALDERMHEAHVLAERCQALVREVADREKQIAASGSAAAGTVLELFHKMLQLAGPRSFDGYTQALQLLIGAKDVSVYVPSDEGWINLSAPLEASSWSSSWTVPDELCDTVASFDGVLSCLRPDEARLLDGHAAMATGIRGRNGRTVGVVFVGEVDPACLTRAGEAAVTLGSFILGSRYLEPGMPAIEEAAGHATRVQLKIVNNNGALGQSQP